DKKHTGAALVPAGRLRRRTTPSHPGETLPGCGIVVNSSVSEKPYRVAALSLQSLPLASAVRTSLAAPPEGSAVKSLYSRLTFTGFGPHSLLAGGVAPPLEVVHGHRPSRLREKVRKCCPRRPGVYGMV